MYFQSIVPYIEKDPSVYQTVVWGQEGPFVIVVTFVEPAFNQHYIITSSIYVTDGDRFIKSISFYVEVVGERPPFSLDFSDSPKSLFTYTTATDGLPSVHEEVCRHMLYLMGNDIEDHPAKEGLIKTIEILREAAQQDEEKENPLEENNEREH